MFMKLYYLNSLIPVRYKKCGVDPVSAAITGGATVLSGIIGADASQYATDVNIEENQKNRDFNREEAQKTRDWQTSEREATQGWESSEYDRRNELQYQTWLKQNEYNSPKNQMHRLSAAGLNPAAMLGSTAGTGLIDSSQIAPAVSGVSAPGSAPASVSTANPAASLNPAQGFQSVVGGVADLVKSFASASKDSSEARLNNETLQYKIAQYMLDNTNKKLLNDYQALHNYFYEQKQPQEIKKLGAEIDKITTDIFVAKLTGDKIEEETITERFKQALLGIQHDLTGEQYKQAVIYTGVYKDSLLAQIGLWKAQTYNQSEMGRLAGEQATTEHQFRDVKAAILDLDYDTASEALNKLKGETAGQMIDNIRKLFGMDRSNIADTFVNLVIRSGAENRETFLKYLKDNGVDVDKYFKE